MNSPDVESEAAVRAPVSHPSDKACSPCGGMGGRGTPRTKGATNRTGSPTPPPAGRGNSGGGGGGAQSQSADTTSPDEDDDDDEKCRSWRWWLTVVAAAVVVIPLAFLLIVFVVAIVNAILHANPMSLRPLVEEMRRLHRLRNGNVPIQFLSNDGQHFSRLDRLAEAIRYRTIANAPGDINTDELLAMHQFLKTAFPLIHSTPWITRIVVSNYSLLYMIGINQNGEYVANITDTSLMPYLLAAHLDVVPVEEAEWSHGPFQAKRDERKLWGRGTIDDKHAVMGILEALEGLIKSNWTPVRPFFVAFGHDEEVGGESGARNIVGKIQRLGFGELDFILDEGFFYTQKFFPGVSRPAAMIGVSEKGYLSVELNVTHNGGHSSYPSRENAITILGSAVARLSRTPQPAMFKSGITHDFFDFMAPHADFLFKIVYANPYIFEVPLRWAMSARAQTEPLIRTTTAVTIFEAGIKENVIPTRARAIVNHRVHPDQTAQSVLEHDRRAIDDPRVTVSPIMLRASIPNLTPLMQQPISEYGSGVVPFELISATIKQVEPKSFVVPALLIGNTDCKWYGPLSRHVYRFTPAWYTPNITNRIHGVDEFIGIDEYRRVVDFYHRLIVNADLYVAKSKHRVVDQKQQQQQEEQPQKDRVATDGTAAGAGGGGGGPKSTRSVEL